MYVCLEIVGAKIEIRQLGQPPKHVTLFSPPDRERNLLFVVRASNPDAFPVIPYLFLKGHTTTNGGCKILSFIRFFMLSQISLRGGRGVYMERAYSSFHSRGSQGAKNITVPIHCWLCFSLTPPGFPHLFFSKRSKV